MVQNLRGYQRDTTAEGYAAGIHSVVDCIGRTAVGGEGGLIDVRNCGESRTRKAQQIYVIGAVWISID